MQLRTNMQKIILFLLQKGNKSFNLNLSGLFVGSMKNVALINKYIFLIEIMFNIKYHKVLMHNQDTSGIFLLACK